MSTASSAAAIGIVIGGVAVLHSWTVSGWSTLHNHHTTPHRHRLRLHSITTRRHALPADDDVDDDAGEGSSGSRRRKRDILKRTLGLGAGSEEPSSVVKLNTDGLFEGVPGVNTLLGGSSSSSILPDVGTPDDFPSAPSAPASGGGMEQMGFRTQGRLKKEPDLLSPEDVRELDAEYDSVRSRSERLVSEELSKGAAGALFAGNEKSGEQRGDNDNGGNITEDEAKKIVDYAVEEERATERRRRDLARKEELVRGWEREGRDREESIDRDLSNAGDDGAEDMLRNDALASEIIDVAEERTRVDEEKVARRLELDSYERRVQMRKDVEGVVEEAATRIANNDYGTAEGSEVDIDDVYEDSLNRIKSSRSERLGPRTLGVLANSIALEEGLEYVRGRKREKEFLAEVDEEARRLGVETDEEVAEFFRSPKSREEERMYRSIVRQIVDRRREEQRVDMESAEDEGIGEEGMAAAEEEEAPDATVGKYELGPAETVEAYKLLGLWREMKIEQDSMERALGMRDDSNSDPDNGRSARRPTNRVEPLFLYEEDTEEKRRVEKERLAKVLRRGLRRDDDDVESASNEVLTRELLEGGITRERAARLLDKLLGKPNLDEAIRSSLVEMREVILEEDEDPPPAAVGGGGGAWGADAKPGQPLDLSGVFRTSDVIEAEEAERASSLSSSTSSANSLGSNNAGGAKTMPSWVDDERKESPPPPPPPPPNTPFFAPSPMEETTAAAAEVAAAPPPPNTPFFQGAEGEGRDDDVSDAPTGGMFGTYEEQSLQRLASRVGASTDEDVEELRRNMEAIKEAEELASAQLSDDEFDVEAASAALGIDVGSLDLDDEGVGGGGIASLLGKRPTAASKEKNSVTMEFDERDESSEGIVVDAAGRLRRMEGKKDTEEGSADIAGDLFRARTAGRQYDDRATRDADEAAFREFVRAEEDAEREFEASEGVEEGGGTTAAAEGGGVEEVDVDEYAEDVMAEMKPRPRVRGRREDVMSQEEIFSERKKESIFGDDDPFPARDGGPGPAASALQGGGGGGGSMPEWFRKEQEARGIKPEDIKEDDFDEARREWEREERQRKADEYLEKRGEGISISDVLGREYFGPMDEPDDNYGMGPRPGFDGFEARKELLLGYAELTVEDINNVVDYKVDPLATGYNPYLSRVQKPFSEYAAVFRLEGVLADMIGMHGRAWRTVSAEFGYGIESGDEVKQASLYKPEDAVREVFRWTDDIFLIRDIADAHRVAFREAFDEWLASGASAATASDDDYWADSAEDAATGPRVAPSDEEMNSMYYLCWSKLAKTLDKPTPSSDDVRRGVLGGDWEVAVREIFGWSEDPTEAYDIVVAYDEILQADYRVLLHKYGIDLDKVDAEEDETLYGLKFPDLSAKEEVKGWLDVLREVDMPIVVVSHLDSSQLDAVLNATGLASYFPPDKRVSSSSDYSSERSELLGAALRAERRPDACVAFDNAPRAAEEAHEVCMKCVSFVDHYARYELLTADHSVASARDLDLIGFVKLFDERTDLEPVLELDVDSGMQKEQRKVKTAFWDE